MFFHVELSEQAARIYAEASRLAAERMQPVELDLDRLGEPAVLREHQGFRDVVQEGYQLGLHRVTVAEQFGGYGLSVLDQLVIVEEIAAQGAPGLAFYFAAAPLSANIIQAYKLHRTSTAYRDYLDRFVSDVEAMHCGAWAFTEPTVGSDMFSLDTPGIGFGTEAVRKDGPEGPFVVTGTKSAYVTNGSACDMILLMAKVGEQDTMDSTGAFLMPADLPGITRGAPIDKLGLRATDQAEIHLDAVEVPAEMLVLQPGDHYRRFLEGMVAGGNSAMGFLAAGIARRAFELGLAYAKERTQGGRRIFDFDLVRTKLFRAYRDIEAGRALLLRGAQMMTQRQRDLRLIFAGRTLACEAAVRVTGEMIDVLGAYGITRESELEKLYRDAKMLTIADGTLDRVSLYAAATL